jgi:hypothetical protein
MALKTATGLSDAPKVILGGLALPKSCAEDFRKTSAPRQQTTEIPLFFASGGNRSHGLANAAESA